MLIRLFVNRYLIAGDTAWAQPVIIGLTVAAILAAGIVGMQYAVLRMVVLRLSRSGQTGFTWRILNMRIPALQGFGSGDLVARLNARQRMSFQGGMLLPLAIINFIYAAAYMLMLFLLDLRLGLVGLLVCLLTVVVSRRALRRHQRAQELADEDKVALSAYTAEVIEAAESIKAAAWEQFAFAHWARLRKSTAQSLTRLGVATQTVTLVPVLAVSLGLGLFLAVGVLQVFGGSVSLGTLVACQAYIVALLNALGMLVVAGVLIQSIASAAAQSDAIFREPLDPEVMRGGDSVPLRGGLQIRDVVFGYDQPLINHLSLEIAPGARVALVGRSGSGKTTVARLVIGELRPWSGHIALDGVPRLQVARDVRTQDIAYVPQTSVLFPGTIRDNLTLWDEDISDEAVRRACRDASIETTILGRPGAYYHEVHNTDGGFSGGELQRLAIARALVRYPKVLVLDEATSALDPVVEAEVEARLRTRGCTCLVVAHRLSTIRDADEILVIDGGAVVQRGRYEDVKTHGFFAELLDG
jgi:ABC-type bacteriocin/lantibiotic exporter with double-glycine peptidase domain